MIGLLSKPNHCDPDHDIMWTTCVCSFEMDHMTMCVFGVIRKLQLWFITLCIILHISAQQQGHRPGDHPTRGVIIIIIIITVLGTRIFCQYHSRTSRHKNHLWILSHPISTRFLLLSSQSPVDPVSSPLLLLISQEADIGKFFQIQNLMIYLWIQNDIYVNIT